jgi:ABC-type lipoprotein release transport system permease subunit
MKEIAHSKDVVNELRGAVDGSMNYVIYSSHDLIRYISGSMQDIVNIMHWIMMFIILALATFAIYHAMDNVVLRKIREIGTLKAFGATDGAILEIFLNQALFIGFLSGGFAVGISVIAMRFINWYGGLSIGFIGETQLDIKFLVTWSLVLTTFILPILVSILASILPAKKAATLSPVEALKKGEISL